MSIYDWFKSSYKEENENLKLALKIQNRKVEELESKVNSDLYKMFVSSEISRRFGEYRDYIIDNRGNITKKTDYDRLVEYQVGDKLKVGRLQLNWGVSSTADYYCRSDDLVFNSELAQKLYELIDTLLFGVEKKVSDKNKVSEKKVSDKKNKRLEKYERIKKLKAEGKSWNEIAKELHSNRLAVYQYHHYYSRKEGAKRVSLKDLTEKNLKQYKRYEAIAKMRKKGYKWREIGAKFNISRKAAEQYMRFGREKFGEI